MQTESTLAQQSKVHIRLAFFSLGVRFSFRALQRPSSLPPWIPLCRFWASTSAAASWQLSTSLARIVNVAGALLISTLVTLRLYGDEDIARPPIFISPCSPSPAKARSWLQTLRHCSWCAGRPQYFIIVCDARSTNRDPAGYPRCRARSGSEWRRLQAADQRK